MEFAARCKVEPLGRDHNREGFSCGVESLDSYLKTQATQDIRRKANAVFSWSRRAIQRRSLATSPCAHTVCLQARFPMRRVDSSRGIRS